jgi:hypothetical protein
MGGKKWPTQFPAARLQRHPSIATTRISQEEYKSLASEVMRHVFDIQ